MYRFVAHVANLTVMDLSDSQLLKKESVAKREKYTIHIVKSDSSNLSRSFPFENDSFYMIFNPVSNCYIEEIQPMWN